MKRSSGSANNHLVFLNDKLNERQRMEGGVASVSDRPMLLKYLRIAEFYLEASESAPMNLLAHAGVLLCNENFEYLVMHPTDPTFHIKKGIGTRASLST